MIATLETVTAPGANTVPSTSVIVVNWNTRHMLPICLGSLSQAAGGLPFDAWLVDNASSDGSVATVREHFPWVRVVANEGNNGFAAANNQAMELASGDYFLLLNSDAAAGPASLARMVALAEAHPRAGIVGARLLNPDGSFQASYSPYPTLLREALILSTLGRRLYGPWYPSAGPDDAGGSRRVDYVEGACLLVRRAAWQAVGGFDEGFFMYSEEVDWCRRMDDAGWEVWYEPTAVVYHWGGGSSMSRKPEREADLYRSRMRYQAIHAGRVQAQIFRAMVLAATAVKVGWHGLRRRLGWGKPRPVVSLRRLAEALRRV